MVWHLSFVDGLEGAALDSNASDLVGCYDLSNPITVVRDSMGTACDTMMTSVVAGGILSIQGDSVLSVDICAGDGASDIIEVDLIGAVGDSSAWLITDTSGVILELPSSPPFDLEGAGPGICLVWHLSYNDSIVGLEIDSS